MRFVRKVTRNAGSGVIIIPKPVLEMWKDVSHVEFLFDERNNALVVTPFD